MNRVTIDKLMKSSGVPQIFIEDHKIHDPVSFDYKIKKEGKVRTAKKQLALIKRLKSNVWDEPYTLIISSWPTIYSSMETAVGLIWHKAKKSDHYFLNDLSVVTPHNWKRSSFKSPRTKTVLIANLTQNSMPSEFSIIREMLWYYQDDFVILSVATTNPIYFAWYKLHWIVKGTLHLSKNTTTVQF